MRQSLSAVCILTATLFVAAGQDPANGPAFDVVSVKPGGPASTPALPGEKVFSRNRHIRYINGRVTALDTLKHLIQEAYSVEDWAAEGPSWFNQEMYEIAATMPPETSRETALLMLRRVLAERLGLQFHIVSRDIPIYVLVPGKQGFKLRPLPESAEKPPTYYSGYSDRFEGTGTLDSFALYFRSYSDAPVINKTAIPGLYHLEFRWAREPDVDYKDQFWAALERSAGLRREKRKLPCEVIVVDHALRTPTPN